ncbi:MAG: hypothetical protein IKL14_02955 [Alphaproteobacteria bacterium]|nr:hypothetical protein [Alphaproteobacteria bacterium]
MNRWTFDNDELFDLVRNGRKCGTCGRYSDASPMANVSEIQEIFNSLVKQYGFRLHLFANAVFVTLMTHGQK